ncbi:helix-turn-helix domain-containing protein [Cylindrospermum sp. FACHB-282]|uniref:helix-turn-helix domain-containing protein n=1 Tax=Cylindrospermum sp. FACHB-282 TaxID=2692794 RepID=UPI001682E7C0|nr:helix-turn-helix domain-containing protein [Cylindrospermum sp. FACHB-282]MBD2385485.1 helix-turn-helix domain-containing protein [Cylindrospermum sp. FACHB-282]
MKKILVIEGTEETRNLFLKAIRLQGFSTIGAKNGLIGLQKAKEYLPDLIICEIVLPELDGYSILTELRQNSSTAIIPLIFVTVKNTRSDIRKGIELGADDYLTKPCTLEELLRAIATCLEKRATLQQWYGAKSQSDIEPLPTDTDTTIGQAICHSMFPSDPQLIKVFQKVFHFIEANYHQPITLSEVAQEVAYNPAYLTNLVRRQTGKTLQGWIIERRMAAARSLLLLTSDRVEDIAAQIGYQNVVHFFRQFRQHHGTTPQAWRKAQLDQEK